MDAYMELMERMEVMKKMLFSASQFCDLVQIANQTLRYPLSPPSPALSHTAPRQASRFSCIFPYKTNRDLILTVSEYKDTAQTSCAFFPCLLCRENGTEAILGVGTEVKVSFGQKCPYPARSILRHDYLDGGNDGIGNGSGSGSGSGITMLEMSDLKIENQLRHKKSNKSPIY